MAFCWNPTFLNRAIAPGIADFVAGDIPDLSYLSPMTSLWLSNDVLFAIYSDDKHFSGKNRQYAITLLHRAYACWTIYQQARQTSLEFLQQSTRHNPRTALYYNAATQWESGLFTLHMFSDTMVKLQGGHRNFESGDGSVGYRAYAMSQTVHAWSAPAKRLQSLDSDTVPLWLSNEGLHTRTHKISYRELSRLVEEVCIQADMICTPDHYSAAA